MHAFSRSRIGTLADGLTAAGLYFFACFAVLGGSGAELGLGLMLLGMVLRPREVWGCYRSEPIVWLTLVGIAYIVVSAMLAARAFPDYATMQWDQAKAWIRLSEILIVAWALRVGTSRIGIAVILFGVGALTRMLLYAPWDRIADFLAMRLPIHFGGYGLWHISFTAYLATLLMGVVFLGRMLFERIPKGPLRSTSTIAMVAVATVFLGAVVIGRSRGTWLSFGATLALALPWYAWLRRRSGRPALSVMGRGPILATVALVLGVALIAGPAVVKRMSAESKTIEAIVEGPVKDVPQSSIGIRIHLYDVAMERWLERPWFGWGVGSQRKLIRESGRVSWDAGHFHNIYLDMLVRFGLVGSGIAFLILFIAYRRLIVQYRKGRISLEWFVYLISILVFSLIWGLADIRIIKWDYRNYFILFFSITLAFIPPWRPANESVDS